MNKNISYRLLLINPWIFDFTAFDLWSKPIGLLYLASYLRNLGYKIDFIDCLDKHHPAIRHYMPNARIKIKKFGTGPFLKEIVKKPEILDFIPRYFSRFGMPETLLRKELARIPKPDAVLVTSFMTYWYYGPQEVIKIIREVFPGIPVILGGIYATLLPAHARQQIAPDFIVSGAGEVKTAELLNTILPGAPHPDKKIQKLDEFPYPAFDLYHRLDYLPLMTSRGCPYHCTFCATDKVSGSYAQREPDAVFDEIQYSIRKYKINDIAFYDDALLLNRQNRIIPLLEKIIHSGAILRFHTPNGLHARQINNDVAELFIQAGFKTIRLSFETSSDERLNDMNFKVTPDELQMAVENLEHSGYNRKAIEAYVMMGLPEQSFEEIYESILFVHSLGVKVRLASFSPIPGTPDYERAVASGLFPEDADPLLTNKTIYPMYRSIEAYEKFNEVGQLVNALNQVVDRGTNLIGPQELKIALLKLLRSQEMNPSKL